MGLVGAGVSCPGAVPLCDAAPEQLPGSCACARPARAGVLGGQTQRYLCKCVWLALWLTCVGWGRSYASHAAQVRPTQGNACGGRAAWLGCWSRPDSDFMQSALCSLCPRYERQISPAVFRRPAVCFSPLPRRLRWRDAPNSAFGTCISYVPWHVVLQPVKTAWSSAGPSALEAP